MGKLDFDGKEKGQISPVGVAANKKRIRDSLQ